jgi:hypothetical protein
MILRCLAPWTSALPPLKLEGTDQLVLIQDALSQISARESSNCFDFPEFDMEAQENKKAGLMSS